VNQGAGRLFGRDQEIDLIRRAVDDTAAGGGGWHVITGPPGIGKSHLIRVAIELAGERGVAVAAREAFRLDQAAPLITLAGALRDARPATAAFDWLSAQPDHADPYQRLQRLRASLERAAADRPLLIVIDDAQWMDELSALAVRELVPALASSPVRWIFAGRAVSPETPGSQALTWLLRDGVSPIRLGVLDEAATAQLSADVVGAEVDNTVIALAASCGGNPLRTGQLLRALAATGQLVVSEGIASVVGAELPSSFVDSVTEVLESRSEGVRRLLRAASVFARPFTVDAASRLAGLPAVEVFPLLDEAMADFLVEDAGGFAYAHDLVRQAVYSTLPAPVREQLHREVAAITFDAGGPELEVVEHQLRSGRSGAADAVRMLRGVAREIARVAPAAAADLMLNALAATGPDAPGRPELSADAVGLLASAARLDEARRLGEEALRGGLDPETEALLLLGLAEASKHDGANGTAVRYADRGLAHPGIAAATRARLYAIRAHALVYSDDLPGADASGAESDVLGRSSGEFGAAVFGLTARTLVAQAEGRLSDALAHAEVATRLADAEGGAARQRHPRIWLGSALTVLDRFDEAEATLREGRRESERLGSAWAQPLWHYFQAALHAVRGRLEDAVVEAETGVAVAEQLTANQLGVPLLGVLARLAVQRADLERAQGHLAHMRRLIDTGITAPDEDVAWPEATLLAATGAYDAAFALLRGLYDVLPARPGLIAADPAAAAELVALAQAAGHPADALAVAEAARRLAGRNPGSHAAAGAAAHAEGLLHGDLVRLRASVEEFRLTDRPLALAAALADAAVAGRATEPAATVRAWYDEALSIMTDRGAHLPRQRLADRLGDWRGAVATPVPVADEPPCLPQLSPAERRVAMRVAQGQTNSEVADVLFISKHTVDAHLRNIFTKLGVRRRAELAAVVARECGPIP
jgi:DNA-binding CsgD family transcriptional regulator